MTLPIAMRPATNLDLPFVFDNWRKSFRDSDFAFTLTGDVYFGLQKAKMQSALESGIAIVACSPDDHDDLIGFIVSDTRPDSITVVHYLYVKWQYRKRGVAKQMLAHIKPSVPVVWTDIMPVFFDIREAKDLPYLTARELDDFQNQALRTNGDAMTIFSKWFRDKVHVNQKNRDERDKLAPRKKD